MSGRFSFNWRLYWISVFQERPLGDLNSCECSHVVARKHERIIIVLLEVNSKWIFDFIEHIMNSNDIPCNGACNQLFMRWRAGYPKRNIVMREAVSSPTNELRKPFENSWIPVSQISRYPPTVARRSSEQKRMEKKRTHILDILHSFCIATFGLYRPILCVQRTKFGWMKCDGLLLLKFSTHKLSIYVWVFVCDVCIQFTVSLRQLFAHLDIQLTSIYPKNISFNGPSYADKLPDS